MAENCLPSSITCDAPSITRPQIITASSVMTDRVVVITEALPVLLTPVYTIPSQVLVGTKLKYLTVLL